MRLSQKEKTTIEDLKTQEQSCFTKYSMFSKQAKDPVLKKLFKTLADREQKHYDMLCQMSTGKVPDDFLEDMDEMEGEYEPEATYDMNTESKEKTADAFLATDCISGEKLISSEYNTNVFNFSNQMIRKALAKIQQDEQTHAQMLFKYKTVNGMA